MVCLEPPKDRQSVEKKEEDYWRKGEKSQAWPLVIAPAWGSNSNNGSKECAIHRLLPSNGPLTAIERRHAWDHSQKGASALHSTWSPLSLITQKCFGHLQIALFWLAAHLLPSSTFTACTAAWVTQDTFTLSRGSGALVSLLYLPLWGRVFQGKPGHKGAKMSHCWSSGNSEVRGHLSFLEQ